MTRFLLLIALGGALGSLSRGALSLAAPGPWSTLAVNVSGSLAMGWVAALLPENAPAWRALLMTGALGSFTTFSAFSLDALRLMEDGRLRLALLYVGASVALSLAACAAGFALGRL